MKILIVFLWLVTAVSSADTLLDSKMKKEIIFLMPRMCVNVMEKNKYEEIIVGADLPHGYEDPCYTYIAIKPLLHSKMEMFISFYKEHFDTPDETFIIEDVTLTYGSDLSIRCNNGTTTITVKPGSFKAEVQDKERYLTKKSNAIQCQSVIFTDDEKELSSFFTQAKQWKFEAKLNGSQATKTFFEGTAAINYIATEMCNPDIKSISPANNNNGIIEEAIKITKSKLDNTDLYKTKIDKCDGGFTLMYKTVTELLPAKQIECKEKNSTKLYEVTKIDGTKEDLDKKVKIEAVCKKYVCRTCIKPGLPEKCPQKSNCLSVDFIEKQEKVDACNELQLAKCSLAIINNVKINNTGFPTNISCDTTGKFKFHENEISSISCLDKYSPYDNVLNATNPIPGSDLKVSQPSGCVEHDECKCEDGKQNLAFIDKTGQQWLRVNSVKFNGDSNKWIYNRTTANFETIVGEMKNGRSVMCVSPMISKGKSPNPSKSIVIALNVAILLIISLVTIVGVIMFVNKKEKKRAEVKAKKDADKLKKKDDKKSEEKTDGGDKKNQA